jgi:hypothetical protein
MAWMTKPGDANSEKFKEPTVSGNLWRFWLKVGEKKKVLFLADEKIGVHEHMAKIGNNWEKFTCSRDSNCYFCGTGGRSQYVEYSTILDLTPYKSNKGEDRKYARRAFAASGAAIDILNRRRLDKGGVLTGYGVECFRDGEKTPNVGNDFTVSAEKYDPKKLFPEAKEFDFKPIDFEKFLAPLPSHVIEAKLKFGNANVQTTKKSDVAGGAGSEDNSDIPF